MSPGGGTRAADRISVSVLLHFGADPDDLRDHIEDRVRGAAQFHGRRCCLRLGEEDAGVTERRGESVRGALAEVGEEI